MSAPSALLLIALLALVVFGEKPASFELDARPISALKRFYSWEDAKRAASIESEEGMRAKRKQFYAWAGKRSSAPVHYFDEPADVAPTMEKRKQFYAWAGRK